MNANDTISAYVADIEPLSGHARRFTLQPAEGGRFPEFEPGSNIEISMPAMPGDRPTPYSIISSAGITEYYQIIIVDGMSRANGKNAWLNRNARKGDSLQISAPRSGIEFDDRRKSACFLAGGSGITAFLSFFNSVDLADKDYEVWHVVRNTDCLFRHLDDELSRHVKHTTLFVTDSQSFDFNHILAGRDVAKPIYISGSPRFIIAAATAADRLRWDADLLYWDRYALSADFLRFKECANG